LITGRNKVKKVLININRRDKFYKIIKNTNLDS
jgi:hypothetical protein